MSNNISQLIDFDIRHQMFRSATRFIDYELVPGDIFEFGVYTGRSLALLSYFHEVNKKGIHKVDLNRRVVGLDSFEGLPSAEDHPRWKQNMFRVNHSFHPICKEGDKVTEKTILDLFDSYNLPDPEIELGSFTDVLPNVIGTKYKQSALIHIDCDLYESTKTVLKFMEPTFQEGTVLLFDDWFNFKGNKLKGEQRAFNEFLQTQSKWSAIEYQTYATFGKSFIITNN